jgi:microcystin-dependent protein
MSQQAISGGGGGRPHDNVQPFVALNYIICLEGAQPTDRVDHADPFLGEIRMIAGDRVPRGFAACEGQIMELTQNTALFTLLGTTYGGDGRTTFALPDLRGAVAMGYGEGPGLSARNLGDTGGEETVALTEAELPPHGHTMRAAPEPASSATPEPYAVLAVASGGSAYSTHTDARTALAGEALGAGSAAAGHNNLQPYLALRFCVAVAGVYPPRGEDPRQGQAREA